MTMLSCGLKLCIWAETAKTEQLSMFKIKNQSSTSLSPTKVPLILALQNIYCNHHVHSPLNSKSKYIGISVAVTLL